MLYNISKLINALKVFIDVLRNEKVKNINGNTFELIINTIDAIMRSLNRRRRKDGKSE